jgi:hypothetical protein
VSGQLPSPCRLTPCYHCIRGWVGPQRRSVRCGEEKNIAVQGIEAGTSSPQPRNYTDSQQMLCIGQNISTGVKQTSYDTVVLHTLHDRIFHVRRIIVAYIFMHIKHFAQIRSGGRFTGRQGPFLP